MTSVATSEATAFFGNPIDLVEEIVNANDWAHDRASEEELVVEISGRWCDYRLYFVWQEELCAMHFSCSFDMKVAKGRRAAVYELLALANEKLWLGHFDLSSDDNSPAFRHAALLRGIGAGSVEQVEDLVDIALSECERFYPAFQLVLWGGKRPLEAIAAAMIDPVGEA
ncbi:MAG TPA: YbjN domain-containing protein [Stellaceae bacterium]|nr:YbjN domain-containing protein [Stellaceae bacterium]